MVDLLSDVLGSVRLAGAVFVARDSSAPWIGDIPLRSSLAPHAAGIGHVIECHAVSDGSCWLRLDGEPALRLESGDLLVLPRGEPHCVSPAIRPGNLERAQLISGFLACDAHPFSPLFSTLPRVMHLAGAARRDSVCRRLSELGLVESAHDTAGSDCVRTRLGELLFAQVVRQHVAEQSEQSVGWLAGLRDAGVSRALQRLHERPAQAWTLEELAKEVGMSRSTLAERFSYFVGVPPIQYLAQWRIQLAASLLRNSQSSLAEIASRVGYGSEAALSRAFKRQLGISPAPYRRGDRDWRKAS